MRAIIPAIGGAFALLVSTVAANAQFLSFVSATGNDANSCFVEAAPCRTLQRGINATGPGGELRVLSQLTSNGYINKSITIDAEGHTIVGTLIVEGVTATVAFRNIVLTGRDAYGSGFDIRTAASVRLENCTVERFIGNGVDVVANTRIYISHTILRDNGLGGFGTGPTTSKVTVDNSLFQNNSSNGFFINGGEVSISNSISSGNEHGFTFWDAEVSVFESTAGENDNHGVVVSGGTLTMKSSTSHRNGGTGLKVEDGAEVAISRSSIVLNLVGIDNGGTVYALGDNVVEDWNGTHFSGNTIDTTTVNPL